MEVQNGIESDVHLSFTGVGHRFETVKAHMDMVPGNFQTQNREGHFQNAGATKMSPVFARTVWRRYLRPGRWEWTEDKGRIRKLKLGEKRPTATPKNGKQRRWTGIKDRRHALRVWKPVRYILDWKKLDSSTICRRTCNKVTFTGYGRLFVTVFPGRRVNSKLS